MRHPIEVRDRQCAVVGGYALLIAGGLTAAGLAFHPLPEHGFHESFQALSGAPQWALVHIAITAGFALAVVAGLLILSAGGALTGTLWLAWSWAAMTVGLLFFSGTALINAFVMDDLAHNVRAGSDREVFDAFNDLLVGFGWIGNPLFLLGAIALFFNELRHRTMGCPTLIAGIGLITALVACLRAPAGFGLEFLNWVILANVPLFAALAYVGYLIASHGRAPKIPGQ